MKSYIIGDNEAGQRFDKYLFKLLPSAPKSFIYKMLRKKNIVLNDKKCEGQEKTAKGDEVKLWLSDDTISQFSGNEVINNDILALERPVVLYQDENTLLVNKPKGMLSQKDASDEASMVEVITAYLLNEGFLKPEDLKTFHPAVCNRLDRNTSGILVCGISLSGSQSLSELIRNRSVKKEYVCLVKGCVSDEITLKGYLVKDTKTNKVRVFKEKKSEDASYIETHYKPLFTGEDYSVLLVELVTGKSHQIRAHLSSISHPICGDNKYGDINLNKKLKQKYRLSSQLLHAYRLTFPKTQGALVKLSEKVIIADIPAEFKKIIKGENIIWQPGAQED